MGHASTTLIAAQRRALEVLAGRLGDDTYVAGGVAVALRLDHRRSRDLGFFTPNEHPKQLDEALAQIPGISMAGRADGTLYLEVHGVPTSLIRYRYPLLDDIEWVSPIPVPLASVKDTACMKLSALSARGAVRDFWDLHALLRAKAITLPEALGWFQRKYRTEDIGHVVRSLLYFANADAEPRPASLGDGLWKQIKRDFRDWVRVL